MDPKPPGRPLQGLGDIKATWIRQRLQTDIQQISISPVSLSVHLYIYAQYSNTNQSTPPVSQEGQPSTNKSYVGLDACFNHEDFVFGHSTCHELMSASTISLIEPAKTRQELDKLDKNSTRTRQDTSQTNSIRTRQELDNTERPTTHNYGNKFKNSRDNSMKTKLDKLDKNSTKTRHFLDIFLDKGSRREMAGPVTKLFKTRQTRQKLDKNQTSKLDKNPFNVFYPKTKKTCQTRVRQELDKSQTSQTKVRQKLDNSWIESLYTNSTNVQSIIEENPTRLWKQLDNTTNNDLLRHQHNP